MNTLHQSLHMWYVHLSLVLFLTVCGGWDHRLGQITDYSTWPQTMSTGYLGLSEKKNMHALFLQCKQVSGWTCSTRQPPADAHQVRHHSMFPLISVTWLVSSSENRNSTSSSCQQEEPISTDRQLSANRRTPGCQPAVRNSLDWNQLSRPTVRTAETDVSVC